MIQRIQTIYLFLIVVLGALLCFFSPVQFLTPTGTEYIALTTFSKWPLAVLTIAVPLIALVNIFLFKHRLLQARINVVNVVLCLGYYGLLALYIAYICKGNEPINGALLEDADWYLNVWAALPLVNVVLSLMATRRILKDEALVRAADRLR